MTYKKKKASINKSKQIMSFLNRKTMFSIVVVLFVILQVLFTIHTATSGAKLAALEIEKETMTKYNRQQKEKLVAFSSLVKMEGSAERLGFSKPGNTIYVTTEEFVARVP